MRCSMMLVAGLLACFSCVDAMSQEGDMKVLRFSDQLQAESPESIPDVENKVSIYKNVNLSVSQRLSKKDGFSSGLDVILVSPYASEEYDMKATIRPWISFMGEKGAGIRARYWEYESVEATSLKASVLDIDLMGSTQLGKTTLIGSVGATRVSVKDTNTMGVNLTGWGPTLAVGGSRQIGNNFTAYISPRATIIYPELSRGDGVSTMIQQSFGINGGWEIANQMLLTTNVGCDTYNIYGQDANSVGFIGLTLGAGLQW